MGRKSKISEEMKKSAERQLKESQKQIDYDTKDFTVELIIDKFARGDFFIPLYQRNFIWKPKNKTLFIESVLLGLPIPFMFFGNCEDGRVEVIDGAQRLQTLVAFRNGELKLKGLEKLDKLNGFSFNDLPEAQQRKFLNRVLRIVVLEENTSDEVRQDLFNRINTTGMKANDSEVRRGSLLGPFTTFIEECTNNTLFQSLCPISVKNVDRHERFEFILRFFAYVNNYKSFVHDVNTFLDGYLKQNLDSFDQHNGKVEFERMLEFVSQYFPHGFAKTATAKSTPRVRFEAISVGTALALRENPNLTVQNVDWLYSDDFKRHTTSDASNNQGKLRGRIEYVRDQLLRG
ncbi:MAG: DUF262 domain-containing protein [Oscillospiraceae bacterium]|nr:DUF262 domain-containing protein [Oscillospiraceae bacterium]